MAPERTHPGDRHGRLLVLARAHTDKHGARHYACRCACGAKVTVRGANLRSGNTVSCGCFHRERNAERMRTHGMTDSRIWKCHRSMLDRCTNPRARSWADYGGRGITICDRWQGEHGFENFDEDMGEPPEGRSIERIDNDGDYEPQNCRWATASEQRRNQRRAASCGRPKVKEAA